MGFCLRQSALFAKRISLLLLVCSFSTSVENSLASSECLASCDKECQGKGSADGGTEICKDVRVDGPCADTESNPNDDEDDDVDDGDWQCTLFQGDDECEYTRGGNGWSPSSNNSAACPATAPGICDDARQRNPDDVIDDIHRRGGGSQRPTSTINYFWRQIDDSMQAICDCSYQQREKTCKVKKTSVDKGDPTQVSTTPEGNSCIVSICIPVEFDCTGWCPGSGAYEFENLYDLLLL